MIEAGDHVITLVVDGGGGDQEVYLFAVWADAKRAFHAALKEFTKTTFEVEHKRGHWWAYPAVGGSSPWLELKRITVK